jgi:2-polyprenyl-6-methoxyphenol hydroxylase-like FAD-dependent oxidoreductase
MMIMPQARFLEFLVAEAQRYPHFELVLGAHVDRLIDESGAIRGVGYRSSDGGGERRATLTIATDGRFSRVRKLAGMEPVRQSGAMEVMWFRLPRRADDRHDEAAIDVGPREVVAVLGRPTEWQLGYVGPPGRYREVKAQGLDAFRRSIAALLPWLEDRVALLEGWDDISLLSVEASRLTQWHRHCCSAMPRTSCCPSAESASTARSPMPSRRRTCSPSRCGAMPSTTLISWPCNSGAKA